MSKSEYAQFISFKYLKYSWKVKLNCSTYTPFFSYKKNTRPKTVKFLKFTIKVACTSPI